MIHSKYASWGLDFPWLFIYIYSRNVLNIKGTTCNRVIAMKGTNQTKIMPANIPLEEVTKKEKA